MTIINNSDALLNAIKSNSYLTVNNDGQIVKQSTFKGILRKIGDFFSSADTIAQRQAKLDTAMNKMLSETNNISDVSGSFTKKLVASFKKNDLQITAATLNAYARASKMDPKIASFAKSIIKDTSEYVAKYHSPDNKENYVENYIAFLDRAMSDLEKYKPVNPDDPIYINLCNAMNNKLNEVFKDIMAEEKDSTDGISSQFKSDSNRLFLSYNGKIYGLEDREAKFELLQALFPNKNARLFVSEALSQTTQNIGDQLINNARNTQNNTISTYENTPLPDGYPGNYTESIVHEEEYEENENAPAFTFSQSAKNTGGYDLELIKKDEKVVGVKIVTVKPYATRNTPVFGPNGRIGELYHKKEIIIDLSDMDNPKFSSIKTDFSGDNFGYTFSKENKE